jgi:hypothetical protein
MNRKEIYPGIEIWEDFITEKECEYLLNFCKSLTEDGWKELFTKNAPMAYERDGHEQDNFWSDKVAELEWSDPNLESLNDRLREVGVLGENEWHSRLMRVQRQYPGTALPNHYDATQSERIVGAVIVYLNDDYVDGELIFDKLGLKFRPPKRSLLKFKATEDYTHETAVVGEGPERYVMATFTWDNELSSQIGK